MIAEYMKYNASSIFLIKPIIGKSLIGATKLGFIGSYLKDKDREDLDGDFLFILFKPEQYEDLELFIEEQKQQNNNYHEEYDYEGGYVVMVYTFPDFMVKDLRKLREGKYSEFTNYTKTLFNKTTPTGGIFNNLEPSYIWKIFDKDVSLKKEIEKWVGEKLDKDAELFKIPGKEEILDIDKIRTKYESITESFRCS